MTRICLHNSAVRQRIEHILQVTSQKRTCQQVAHELLFPRRPRWLNQTPLKKLSSWNQSSVLALGFSVCKPSKEWKRSTASGLVFDVFSLNTWQTWTKKNEGSSKADDIWKIYIDGCFKKKKESNKSKFFKNRKPVPLVKQKLCPSKSPTTRWWFETNGQWKCRSSHLVQSERRILFAKTLLHKDTRGSFQHDLDKVFRMVKDEAFISPGCLLLKEGRHSLHFCSQDMVQLPVGQRQNVCISLLRAYCPSTYILINEWCIKIHKAFSFCVSLCPTDVYLSVSWCGQVYLVQGFTPYGFITDLDSERKHESIGITAAAL